MAKDADPQRSFKAPDRHQRAAEEEVEALIDAWEAAWSGRAESSFATACAPDLHYEDPLTDGPVQGLAELGAHARRLWSAFPDVRLERMGARLGAGSYVVAPCRLAGTHLHELEGIPPSGRFVVVHVLFYCELDDRGRLWRIRGFFDAYDAAVQIGVLPRRGTLGERAMLLVRGFGVLPGRRRGGGGILSG